MTEKDSRYLIDPDLYTPVVPEQLLPSAIMSLMFSVSALRILETGAPRIYDICNMADC